MSIRIIRDSITKDQVVELARDYFDTLIKGVVDVQREIVALGGDMHADAEQVLLDDGSRQSDLWGFNILLDEDEESCLVYESFINIRPGNGNRQLEVEDLKLRERMKAIIFQRILL